LGDDDQPGTLSQLSKFLLGVSFRRADHLQRDSPAPFDRISVEKAWEMREYRSPFAPLKQ
jgi:hypothetical protein